MNNGGEVRSWEGLAKAPAAPTLSVPPRPPGKPGVAGQRQNAMAESAEGVASSRSSAPAGTYLNCSWPPYGSIQVSAWLWNGIDPTPRVILAPALAGAKRRLPVGQDSDLAIRSGKIGILPHVLDR